MSDTTVKKVSSSTSPAGDMGQKYLVAGKSVAMRLWQDEQPGEPKPKQAREYEICLGELEELVKQNCIWKNR